MKNNSANMEDVMAAMRTGDLGDATRRIQAMLGIDTPGSAKATPAPGAHGDVIDLVAERVEIGARKASPPPTDFVLRHHDTGKGRLSYRLHRPASLPSGAPLLVMLHGCTQDSADFARGTRMNALAEAAGFAVLWPEQSASANPRRCWRWFEAAHQGPDAGEPAAILALCAAVSSDHQLDASQVFVAGLSAGGAMAAVLADIDDPRIAAIAVHSGLAAASATTMAGGIGAMRKPAAAKHRSARRVPTLILHGKSDQVVVPGNADLLFDQALKQAGEPLSTKVTATAYGDRKIAHDVTGRRIVERYLINGLGHAWAGGDPTGSHVSPEGPDASRIMLDFFREQRRT